MESRTPPPVKTETIADVRSPLDVSRLSFKSATDRPPKVRGRLTVPASTSESELEALALADPAVKAHTAGKTVQKVVVAKGRLVSIVVR